MADFDEFYISADEHLFKKISACPDHILWVLLPPPAVQNYIILERGDIIDNFQTAYHACLIAILLQDCCIIMHINFYLYYYFNFIVQLQYDNRYYTNVMLSPVHTSNNVESTSSNATSQMNHSTKSKQIEHVQFVSTSSKGQNFYNKLVRHFLIAGVDGALCY